MENFTFSLKDGTTHTVKTVMDSEIGCFISPFDNTTEVMEAYYCYRNEQENEAFKNQPPELFKFFKLAFTDEDGRTLEDWVGEKDENSAIKVFKRVNGLAGLEVKVVESYQKFSNFASLSIEEVAAQCYEV